MERAELIRYATALTRATVLDNGFAKESCVATCRTLIDVLAYYGVVAEAVYVECRAMNAIAYKAVQEFEAGDELPEGGVAVGIGLPGGPGTDGVKGRYVGRPLHVALVLTEGILDPTLDLTDRPGMPMTPMLFPWHALTRERFLSGERASYMREDGAVVQYDAKPDQKWWHHAPDWGKQNEKPRRAIAGAVIRKLKELGA